MFTYWPFSELLTVLKAMRYGQKLWMHYHIYLARSILINMLLLCVLTMVLQDYTTENIEICKMISLFRLVSELCLIMTPKMLKFQFISQKNMLSLKTELKRLVD